MSGTKLRNYCWTYFADELVIEENDDIKYCVFQKEKCPDTGKIHFQGYTEFKKPMRIKAAQEALGIENAHMEKRLGTRDQARDYCMKDDTRVEGPWEIGDFGSGGQGRRKDLLKLKERALTEDVSNVILSNDVSNFQQMRFVEHLQKYRRPYEGPRNIRYYYGASGTNKSRTAVSEANETSEDYNEISYYNGYWIGYNGSSKVIINDLRANVPLNEILKITDRYKIYLNVKGSVLPWMAKDIWITCDRSPEELYRAEAEKGQLTRRITKLLFFGGTGQGTMSGGNTKPPTTLSLKQILANKDCDEQQQDEQNIEGSYRSADDPR